MHTFLCLSLRALRGALLASALVGCAGSAKPAATPAGVQLDKSAPPPGATQLQPVAAVDGHGCGLFGTLGSYEGAADKLRSKAEALGADYVQITNQKEPYADRECVHKEYELAGIAYRTPAWRPAPSRVVPAAGALVSAGAVPAASAAVPMPSGATAAATRTLSFSARAPHGEGFGVWIDQVEGDSTAPRFQLKYEPGTQRLVLMRHPDAVSVSVAQPFALDEAWHAWRLERGPDRIAVLLDGKVVLLYAVGAATGGGFLLEPGRVELRSVLADTSSN